MKDHYNILFLCTANSARSILAEALANAMSGGRLRAYSAGSTPGGRVQPMALSVLEEANLGTEGLRSKGWDEFAVPGAPELDFVFTVCHKAAGEVCPVWPGQPMTAHWGVEDPAAVQGSAEEQRRAYANAFMVLKNRIAMFAALPFDKLDRLSLKQQLDGIGAAAPVA